MTRQEIFPFHAKDGRYFLWQSSTNGWPTSWNSCTPKQQKSGQVSAPAQDKFPTERVLAARYHVSRQTVRSALKLLEEKGIIKKVQGSGTYLTGKLGDPAKNQILLILHEEPGIFLLQALPVPLSFPGRKRLFPSLQSQPQQL